MIASNFLEAVAESEILSDELPKTQTLEAGKGFSIPVLTMNSSFKGIWRASTKMRMKSSQTLGSSIKQPGPCKWAVGYTRSLRRCQPIVKNNLASKARGRGLASATLAAQQGLLGHEDEAC
jgi:hypothetical protein